MSVDQKQELTALSRALANLEGPREAVMLINEEIAEPDWGPQSGGLKLATGVGIWPGWTC